jgi:hypothetical protein
VVKSLIKIFIQFDKPDGGCPHQYTLEIANEYKYRGIKGERSNGSTGYGACTVI